MLVISTGEGEPTHTLVPCWMTAALPPKYNCTGCFTRAISKLLWEELLHDLVPWIALSGGLEMSWKWWNILASQEMLKRVWSPMNRDRVLFIQTSTPTPDMHPKKNYQIWKALHTKQPKVSTKTPVKLKDHNPNVLSRWMRSTVMFLLRNSVQPNKSPRYMPLLHIIWKMSECLLLYEWL